MGSLISRAQLETVTAHVDDAVAKGATVLAGGRARPGPRPVLLRADAARAHARGDDAVPRRDVRAGRRHLPLQRHRRGRRARQRLRLRPELLLWTRDTERGRALATRLRAGTVNVNEGYAAAWASVDAPMGGMKASGLGRRHGAEGILKYTEAQTVAVQRLLPIAPPRGVPQKLWGRVMTLSLRILRRLPGRALRPDGRPGEPARARRRREPARARAGRRRAARSSATR